MVKKNRTNIEGDCLYCSKSYSFIYMTRHLELCEKRKQFYLEMNKKIKNRKESNIIFLLRISSKYYPDYWMFVEVDDIRNLRLLTNS